jgi:hypothetical protein
VNEIMNSVTLFKNIVISFGSLIILLSRFSIPRVFAAEVRGAVLLAITGFSFEANLDTFWNS